MKITRSHLRKIFVESIADATRAGAEQARNSNVITPEIIAMIDDSVTNAKTKYQRGNAAWKKILNVAKKANRDPELLNKRHGRFFHLLSNMPQPSEFTPGPSSTGSHTIAQIVTDIKDLPRFLVSQRGEDTPAREVNWPAGAGLKLNRELDWSSEEAFQDSLNASGLSFNATRRQVIDHEIEHAVTIIIWLLSGLNLENVVVDGARKSVETVKGDASGWAGNLGDERAEFQRLGDQLVRGGYGTREEPFTRESIVALAVFAHLNNLVIEETGESIARVPLESEVVASLNEATDYVNESNPMYRYFNDLLGLDKDSDHSAGFRASVLRIPRIRELLNMWIENRSSLEPLHHAMLPSIAQKLRSAEYINNNIDEILSSQSGINALAMSDTTQTGDAPSEISGEEETSLAESKVKITRRQLRRHIIEELYIISDGKKAAKTTGKPYKGSRRGKTESQAQQMAAGIALRAREKHGKKGAINRLSGAPKSMAAMTLKDLRNLATIRRGSEVPDSTRRGHERAALPGHIKKRKK